MPVDVVITTRPYSCSIRCGHAARVTLNDPTRWTSRVRCSASSVDVGQVAPADDAGVVDHDVDATELAEGRVDDIATRPTSVDTSFVSPIATPPAATISSATDRAGPTSAPSPSFDPPRSLTTTLAPRAPSSRAYARPMPRPAPVTTATRPSNESCRSLDGSLRRSDSPASQLSFEDLARRVARQRVDERDVLGHLELRQLPAAVFDQLVGRRRRRPAASTTTATGTSPHRSSGRPTTATSPTAGCS